MIVTLRAYLNHTEKAKLNLATGELKNLSLLEAFRARKLPICGVYAVIEGSNVCLYRFDNKLCLRVGKQQFDISEHTRVRLTHVKQQQQRFQLMHGDAIVLDMISSRPIIDPPLSVDSTPFVEKEDFDFMLFITNVISDIGRRHRVFIT